MSITPFFYFNCIAMPAYTSKQLVWASVLALAAVVDVGVGLLCLIAALSQLGPKQLANSHLVLGGAALCCGGMLYLTVYIILLLMHLRREIQNS